MSACGPSTRQQQAHSLAQSVAQLEGRLHQDEQRLQALDERLVVLASRGATRAETGANAPGQAARARLPTPQDGISISEGLPTSGGPRAPPADAATTAALQREEAPTELTQALHAYQRGAFAAAFSQLSLFVRRHPQHTAADRARFWMGECKFEAGALMDAIAQYARLHRDYPQSGKAPEALLKMGLAFEKLAAPAEAQQTYRRLIATFPRSASAELAASRLAENAPAAPKKALRGG